MKSYISHLECSKTGDIYSASEVHNLSKDGMPLLARYDLENLKQNKIKIAGMKNQLQDFGVIKPYYQFPIQPLKFHWEKS